MIKLGIDAVPVKGTLSDLSTLKQWLPLLEICIGWYSSETANFHTWSDKWDLEVPWPFSWNIFENFFPLLFRYTLHSYLQLWLVCFLYNRYTYFLPVFCSCFELFLSVPIMILALPSFLLPCLSFHFLLQVNLMSHLYCMVHNSCPSQCHLPSLHMKYEHSMWLVSFVHLFNRIF